MKRLAMIVCIVVLVAALGAVVGCDGGGDGDSGATPSQVAEEYLKATFALDVDTAYALLSSEDQQMLTKENMEEMASTLPEGIEYDYEIGEETISGDTATVTVKITVTDPSTGEPDEFEDALILIKENGEWKITFGAGQQEDLPIE